MTVKEGPARPPRRASSSSHSWGIIGRPLGARLLRPWMPSRLSLPRASIPTTIFGTMRINRLRLLILVLPLISMSACTGEPPRVTSISTGSLTCGVKDDGTIWCWGNSDEGGQLGDGTTRPRERPGEVTMPDGIEFAEVGVGEFHVCALDSAGAPWCWGKNKLRQLGDGTRDNRGVPGRVALPAGVSFLKMSVGGYHTCGLDADGSAWCWGYNAMGQTGAGGRVRESSVVEVSPPAGLTFSAISAGGYHSCALADDGSVWCWGSNTSGQLGDGSSGNRSRSRRLHPTAVSLPAGTVLTEISAGGVGTGDHTCALTSEGSAWCWGYSIALGDGTDYNLVGGGPLGPVPVAMPPQVVFESIDAGGEHTCALASGGGVWCWGTSINGQLGDGNGAGGASPVAVALPPDEDFTAVAAGDYHACALTTDGAVWCWGYDLGTAQLSPVQVVGL